ncbi:MAG: urate hydroxylase PuuD [Gammaproteobacteria bacterium]|nr:urate hydroxylase PuuD [Gammaproteobacteria bacterium]NNF60419.1 urate hydroxylase PuuD [Gammaproteobacteria bacterium]NNM20653.1 urate hydroxylase PuuD [Gammaproteobacteria bacterium]
MSAYVVEWLSLLGRWLHFIAGIAWVGSSFYFVWLDNHLKPPARDGDADRGVGGELWSVHGGGFYHAQKYRVAPEQLPETLHWFKWEAYTTWLSGMFLLVLLYWWSADVYLIDNSRMALSQAAAISISAAVIAGGWLLYDLMCRSALARNDRLLGVAVAALAVVAAFGLCQVFSGRGAFIHFGAMLGTIMVANVFFIIIPGQRRMVSAAERGEAVDPRPGITAKQRSVHNTYFTLPVLFVMISNHYAMTYSHAYNWLVLIAISAAGALIRVFFVARHKGKASPLPLVVAVFILAGVAAAIAPQAPAKTATQLPVTGIAEVKQVMYSRCAGCHAAMPSYPGFAAAPGGVVLETVAQIEAEAERIYQQVVVLRAMPIGNLTQITEAERAVIAHWYAGLDQ